MLTSIGYYPVIFLTISALFTKTSQNSMEKIADVIKNITRVNNVLQDLIKNYEHLENIYKSKEMVENYVTNAATETSVTKNRTGTYVTRIMIADASAENVKGHQKLKRKVKSKILIGKPTISSNINGNEPLKLATPQILFLDLYDGNKKDYKGMITPKKKRFNVQLKNNMDRESKNYETTTNETEKYTTQTFSSTTTPTKSYSRIGTTTTLSPNGLFIKIKGTIKKPPGKMYVLGGNMKNKTVDLNWNKTKFEEVKRAVIDQNLGSKDMELVMASDNETSEESASVLSIELPAKAIDYTIYKDIYKTNVLRKAYGEACVKLVVKKCHLACKNTVMSVCKPTSSCRKGVKRTFNKSYKNKCAELFGDMVLRSNSPNGDVDENTRSYMAAVCEPADNSISTNLTTVAQPVLSTSTTKYDNDLHILRAKYERACVKISREKCKDACTYAYTKACEGDKCNYKKTRAFRRTCGRQCKIAYRLRLTSRDSSSSSSTSSSDEI